MEATIRKLIVLQDCDCQTQGINEKKALGPVRLKKLEDDLKLFEQKMDEELSRLESVKKIRRQLEQEIEDLEHQLEKSKTKLANIKSNNEYKAALKEIEDLEKKKAQCEDNTLKIMEESESSEEKLQEINEQRESFRKRFEQDQKEVQEELTALEQNFKKHETARTKIRNEIDKDILKKYDFICEHKDGIGLSSVIKGVCQACHLGIPPQKFNELMRGDVLMNCPHCKRIIYWGEDERFKVEEDSVLL